MGRRRFSASALAKRLLEFDGRCADCKCKVGGPAGLQWDHIIPLAMHGEDEIENLQPLCRMCHRAKTAQDKADIGKAKRMDQRRAGIGRQSRNPLPGGRDSTIKITFNGPVHRDTGEPL